MPKSVGKRSANCLSVITLVLVVFQIIAGLAAIITVEVFKFSLYKYMEKNQRGEMQVMLLFIDIFGVQLVIYYSCGCRLIKKSHQEPLAPNITTMLCLWHFFITVAILSGLLLSYVLFKNEPYLEKSTELALIRGMELYYSDPEWRLTWDDLQYHGQCCGVRNYDEWESSAWIEESSKKDNQSPCDSELISLVPFSCCRSDQESDCIENHIPYKIDAIWGELPAINISALNKKGCFLIFQNDLKNLTIAILVICISVLFVEIIIIILTKMSYALAKKSFSGLNEGDSECQATIVVKCPHNFQCDITQDSEFEEGDSEEQIHRKSYPCRARRKVSFECNDEFSPLLLH